MNKDEVIKLEEINQRSKSNTKRINDHDTEIEHLKNNQLILEKMDYRMGKVESSIEKIDKKLDSVNEAKGMKWDKLIDYIFYAILAFCLWKLGLK